MPQLQPATHPKTPTTLDEPPTDPQAISPMLLAPVEDQNGQDVIVAALKLLPACHRCRKLRRKCDPGLPACRLCTKSQSECCYYDHALQQILPRSYVKSLIERLRRLQQGSGATPRPSLVVSDERLSPGTRLPAPPPRGSISEQDVPVDLPAISHLVSSTANTGDYHYVVPTASGLKTRFHGRSSVFSLTVAVLGRAQVDFPRILTERSPDTVVIAPEDPCVMLDGGSCRISEAVIRSSARLYMSSINVIYPFLSTQTVDESTELFLRMQATGGEPSTREEAFRVFCVAMILAITSASRSRLNRDWVTVDNLCHVKAAKHIETVTSVQSMQSLHALMLLILYCLFRPRRGDIWKLLDYACRLSIELGLHSEPTGSAEQDSEAQETRRNTFWGLYIIERIVGQVFGRPSDLPEAMFTTRLPTITDRNSTVGVLGDEQVQEFSAAHHYRLVYLRSQLYRDLYLPSDPPEHPLSWYASRLAPIMSWYRQMKTNNPEESLSGVGTLTCGVAFHSTIVFLFQSVILRHLEQTRDRTASIVGEFPIDSFYSACRLIQIYNKVTGARADSVLGTYPLTFMGAHYCWSAAMTIIAHSLLVLDGRLVPKRLITDVELLKEGIQLNNIVEMSNSCLVLLQFCAEQWPGMLGMVDVYKSLAHNIIPRMVGKETF
ncbi:Fungal Zn2-Cys6 binuclear cluster domain-containing protein [Cladophialophora immunda]|nr:Fungal Zn2-Cys6 binuclear cluster domain-containing protein [Cladophialophora immunda]